MPDLNSSTENEENKFALNKPLYDSSLKIRDEVNLMTERISKMEEHKGEISEAVYLRVKSDYLAKQDLVKKEFEEKKKEIRKELLVLYRGQRDQEVELQKHKEVLEEAKFRNLLGEYPDQKTKEIESKENSELKRYEHLLALIQTNIKQYEDIVGGPVEELPIAEPTAVPPKNIVPEKPKSEDKKEKTEEKKSEAKKEEKIENQDYYTGSEGSYFELGEDLFGESSSVKKKEKISPVKEEKPKETKPEILPKQPEVKKEIKEEIEKKSRAEEAEEVAFDDSISSILRDIPLEDVEEQTGHIDAAALEEAEKISPQPSSISSAEKSFIKAKIVSVEGDLQPPEIELGETTSLGRSPSNDIVLKEAKVSRQHAAIQLKEEKHVVIDLKSSNGVFVNGKKVEEQALEDGDEIAIGSYRMIYRKI